MATYATGAYAGSAYATGTAAAPPPPPPPPAVTTGSPMPLMYVGLSFGAPFASPQNYNDITKYVRSVRTKRGRQHALGNFMAGTCTLVLDGRDRQMDPTNTSSAYISGLTINKAIQVGAVANCLTVAEAAITAGWTAGANTTLGYGSNVLTITASANGTVSAFTPTGTSGFRVLPSRSYYARLTSNTVSGLTATYSVTWYDVTGASLSTVTAFTGTEGSTSVASVTSPATAYYGSVNYSVAGTSSGSHHLVTQAGLIDLFAVNSNAWVGGGTQPIFTGYIERINPQWLSNKGTDIEITASDLLRVLATLNFPPDPLIAQAQNDSATSIWPLDDPAGNVTAREVVNSNAGYSAGNDTTFGSAARSGAFSSSTTTFTGSTYLPAGALPGITLLAGYVPANATTWAVSAWFNCPVAGSPAMVLYAQTDRPGNEIIKLNIGTTAGATSVYGSCTHAGSVQGIQSAASTYNDGKWHYAALLYSGSTLTLYVDGVSVGSRASTSTISAAATFGYIGQTLLYGAGNLSVQVSSVVVYGSGAPTLALTNTLGSVYFASTTTKAYIQACLNVLATTGQIPVLAGDPGISTIASPTSPPGQALAYLQAVATAENGLLFVAPGGTLTLLDRHHNSNPVSVMTFGDGGITEASYKPRPDAGYDNVDLYNSSTVSGTTGHIQSASDTTQIGALGTALNLNETGLQIANDTEMLNRAQYNVSRYKTPQLRVRMVEVDLLAEASRSNAAAYFLTGGVDVGSVVTLNRRPYNYTTGAFGTPTFTTVSMVEGVEHAITPQSWATTVMLSPADTQTYWVLGNTTAGVLDSTTRLSY